MGNFSYKSLNIKEHMDIKQWKKINFEFSTFFTGT